MCCHVQRDDSRPMGNAWKARDLIIRFDRVRLNSDVCQWLSNTLEACSEFSLRGGGSKGGGWVGLWGGPAPPRRP